MWRLRHPAWIVSIVFFVAVLAALPFFGPWASPSAPALKVIDPIDVGENSVLRPKEDAFNKVVTKVNAERDSNHYWESWCKFGRNCFFTVSVIIAAAIPVICTIFGLQPPKPPDQEKANASGKLTGAVLVIAVCASISAASQFLEKKVDSSRLSYNQQSLRLFDAAAEAKRKFRIAKNATEADEIIDNLERKLYEAP